MSGKKLGIINPTEELFSDTIERRTGKIFDFERQPPDSCYHVEASDVFKNILQVDAGKGKCNGTVFRFALRREASKLSKTIYDGKRVKELFQIFRAEGHLALMFLKNLAKIEFYTRRKGSDHVECLFSFFVTKDNDEQPRHAENQFMKNVKVAADKDSSHTDLYSVNHVNINSFINDDTLPQTTSAKYIIVHYYGGKLLQKEHGLISAEQAKAQGLIPLVGVAYQRSESKSTDGHIFCVLPLPVIEKKSTGLPVHVNGYFALGPDRKDLKWPSLEQSASSDKEVSWNLFLLLKVLPAAYIKLFQHLKEDMAQVQIVHNSLPDVNEVDYRWRKFAVKVLSRIFQTKCFWSCAISEWISPEAACIMDKSRKGHKGASAFLKICSHPLVFITEHVAQGMNKCKVSMETLSSKDLSRLILENDDKMKSLEYMERIDLLRYALKDPGDIKYFFHLPVLPLEDDSFACPDNSKDNPLFMTSNAHPIDLVPGCKKHIIKTNIQEDLMKMFKKIAENRKSYCSAITKIMI